MRIYTLCIKCRKHFNKDVENDQKYYHFVCDFCEEHCKNDI